MLMKKMVLSILLVLLAFQANAQYVREGYLERSRSHLELDGRRLSKAEQELLLSDICGYDYNRDWDVAKSLKMLFKAETILGGVVTLGGLTGCFTYSVLYTTDAIAGGFARDPEGTKKTIAEKRQGIRESALVTIVGMAMLGSGIPLMVNQNRKMNNIVQYYNGEELPNPPRYPSAQLTLGPTPSGIGLAIHF